MAKDNKKFQQNRAKKIAKAKAAKRKKAKAQPALSPFEKRYGVTPFELMAAPFYAVYYTPTLFKDGMGQVIVSRELDDGLIAHAAILLDIYCLGVKNAFLRILTPEQFEEMVAGVKDHGMLLEEADPEFICKLVNAAIAYARSIGFEPHPDFRDASILLSGVDSSRCTDSFVFGKDGKPFYISGPNAFEAQDRAIIARLAAKLGPNGFHYLTKIDL